MNLYIETTTRLPYALNLAPAVAANLRPEHIVEMWVAYINGDNDYAGLQVLCQPDPNEVRQAGLSYLIGQRFAIPMKDITSILIMK